MADNLPYSDTTVSVMKSTGEIKWLLEEKAGCTQVLESRSDGKLQIVAIKDGLTYLFEFDREHIAKRVAASKARRSPIDEKMLVKADRIGWRIIWHQVKHMAVCVQYGLVSMERGFANHLVDVDRKGRLNYMADIIGEQNRAGQLQGGNIAQALLPQITESPSD